MAMGLVQRLRCWRVQKVLQTYLDGQADSATEARVAQHLRACQRCGHEAQVYDEIRRAVARRVREPDDAAVRRLQALADHLAHTDSDQTDTGSTDTDNTNEQA